MSDTNFSLEGKVAIITGGGTGIGKEITLTFARAGADVAVGARRLNLIEETAKEVEALGRRALAVQCDTSQKAYLDNLVQKTLDKFWFCLETVSMDYSSSDSF